LLIKSTPTNLDRAICEIIEKGIRAHLEAIIGNI